MENIEAEAKEKGHRLTVTVPVSMWMRLQQEKGQNYNSYAEIINTALRQFFSDVNEV